MKKVLVSLLSIALIGCSQPILNNTSQYSDLDKEYSQFKTEALTQSYLKKKMDKWLSDAKYSKSLVREIEYAKFKHKDLLKDIVALQPIMFDNITANTAVTTKRIESPFENYIEYIDPYPSAVTANSATNITTSSFTAHWTSNTKATSYKLFVNGSEVYSGANTSFDVTNLSFGSTPTYYVKAVNSAGTSPNSNTISVTLNPDTVTALDATDITQTSFTANWSSLTGATSYKLKIDNGSFVDVGNVTSSNVTGLTIGSSHTYSVQAVNAGGTGSSSNIISVTLLLSAPVATDATDITMTGFTANWNAVSGATGYKLFIDGSVSPISLGNVTSYALPTINGSSHSYSVKAINASGDSSSSNTINLTLKSFTTLAEVNSIGTTGALTWESFQIGEEHYLAVANFATNPTAGGGININSNIYKWDTLSSKFNTTPYQTFATVGARNWKFFTIGSDNYIAISNFGSAGVNTNSQIYKWNTTTKQFDFYQNIVTNAATNCEHFTIGTDHYLAISFLFISGGSESTNSKVYKWNTTTKQFNLFQNISTVGAYDSEYFQIGSDHYLAFAHFKNGGNYSQTSKIYKWNGTQFAEFQSITTYGAVDWEFFSIGSNYYLALANENDNASLTINSKIYKFNSNTNQFEEFKLITTSGATNFKYFQIGISNYLAVANSRNSSTASVDSKVYLLD